MPESYLVGFPVIGLRLQGMYLGRNAAYNSFVLFPVSSHFGCTISEEENNYIYQEKTNTIF